MWVATVFELITSSVGDLTLRPSLGEEAEDLALARAEAGGVLVLRVAVSVPVRLGCGSTE